MVFNSSTLPFINKTILIAINDCRYIDEAKPSMPSIQLIALVSSMIDIIENGIDKKPKFIVPSTPYSPKLTILKL